MRYVKRQERGLFTPGEYPFLPPDSETAQHIKAEQERMIVITQNAGHMVIEGVGELDL